MPQISDGELYDALRQADAAGDSKSARRLAEYIRERHQQSPQSADPTMLNPDAFEGLKKTGKHADDGAFVAFMGGAIQSMNEAGGKIRGWFGAETPEEKQQMEKAKRVTENLSAEHPMATTAGQITGAAVPAMVGWEAGGSLVPELATSSKLLNAGSRVFKAAAGSVGSQLATGELPSAKTTAADVVLNELTGGVFGAVAKGMNKTRDIIGRPIEKVMQAAERIGIKPSLAVASGGKGAQVIEDILAKTPGGAGVIKSHYEQEFQVIDNFLERIKARHGSQSDSSQLGREILRGLETFTRHFQDKSEKLYDDLWSKFPRSSKVEIKNFTRTLSNILNKYDNPALNDIFKDKKLASILEVIKGGDTEAQDILYSLTGELHSPAETINDIKTLRTRIGAAIDNPNLLSSSTEDEELRQLYGALSQDIEDGAEKAGPEAKKAWQRANSYWAAGRHRIDDFLNPLARLQTEDQVYKNLFGAEGKSAVAIDPAKAAAILKSLPENVRGKVVSEIIQRMGEAKAGAQGATGGEFSPSTLLTNWNRLSDGAKRAIFSDGATRADMNALAIYSEAFKDLAKSRNVSQTGQYQIMASLLTGALLNPIRGIPALGGVVGGSRLTSKLMSSPKFINWMRQTADSGGSADLGRKIGKLIAIYWAHPHLQDDIKKYADGYSSSEEE